MTEKNDGFEVARDAFHAHLDECERCRNEPFNLCPKGYELLKTAATGGTK